MKSMKKNPAGAAGFGLQAPFRANNFATTNMS
jgi:hypothetical protein